MMVLISRDCWSILSIISGPVLWGWMASLKSLLPLFWKPLRAMKFTHFSPWMNLRSGLKGKTLNLGKSNITKVWVLQPQKRPKSISLKLKSIRLTLSMSIMKMMMWSSLLSTRSWLIEERSGLLPIQFTTMWIIQRSSFVIATSWIKSWSSSQLRIARVLSLASVMVWSLASARFSSPASRGSSRVRSRSLSWVDMWLSTQHIITVKYLSARQLSPWHKILWGATMSTCCCPSDSLVLGIREVRRLPRQDTSSPVWIQWPEHCFMNLMMQCWTT